MGMVGGTDFGAKMEQKDADERNLQQNKALFIYFRAIATQ
jgi:hypothetical protein